MRRYKALAADSVRKSRSVWLVHFDSGTGRYLQEEISSARARSLAQEGTYMELLKRNGENGLTVFPREFLKFQILEAFERKLMQARRIISNPRGE